MLEIVESARGHTLVLRLMMIGLILLGKLSLGILMILLLLLLCHILLCLEVVILMVAFVVVEIEHLVVVVAFVVVAIVSVYPIAVVGELVIHILENCRGEHKGNCRLHSICLVENFCMGLSAKNGSCFRICKICPC